MDRGSLLTAHRAGPTGPTVTCFLGWESQDKAALPEGTFERTQAGVALPLEHSGVPALFV